MLVTTRAASTLLSLTSILTLLIPAYCRLQFCEATNAPKKPGVRCAFRATVPGSSSKYQIGLPASNSSFNSCQASCFNTAACRTFGFDDTNVCYLYSKNLKTLKAKKNGSSTTRYWTRQCFNPTYYNTLPLVNGGFEAGELNPWRPLTDAANGTANATLNSPYPISGVSYDVSLDNTNPPNSTTYPYFYFDNFPFLCKGVTYSLAFKALQPQGQTVPNGNDLPEVEIYLGNQYTFAFMNATTLSVYGQNSYPAGTAFQWPETLTFTAPTTGYANRVSVQINDRPYTKTRLVFDDFVLTAQE